MGVVMTIVPVGQYVPCFSLHPSPQWNLHLSQSKAPVGAIAGGVVGGVVLIALIILGFIFYRRRARKNQGYKESKFDPLSPRTQNTLLDMESQPPPPPLSRAALDSKAAARAAKSTQPGSSGSSAVAISRPPNPSAKRKAAAAAAAAARSLADGNNASRDDLHTPLDGSPNGENEDVAQREELYLMKRLDDIRTQRFGAPPAYDDGLGMEGGSVSAAPPDHPSMLESSAASVSK
jgi:hypothetical protein